MGEATRIIRATVTPAVGGEPLHAQPVFAAPFHVVGDPAGVPYSYGGSRNPTWTALERAIGGLEVAADVAPVRVFASGQAATAAVLGAVLRAGDTVVLPAGVYFGTSQLVEEQFVPFGVTVRTVAVSELGSREVLAGARLVWLETPSNPEFKITDIAAVAEAAHAAGALVAVDNTTVTPLSQRPLELGADLSVCSDSKSMSGQSDVVMGHVATRDADLLAKLDRHRGLTGGTPGPMEAWLMLRSLGTLPLRMERSSANALALAEMLDARGLAVLYPGLKTHPGHAVAARQMRFFGPLLGFPLKSQEMAERFLAGCRLVTQASSFGGIATTAERRARWGHDKVAPGFIRMSAGCEDAEDLLADVAQALDACGE